MPKPLDDPFLLDWRDDPLPPTAEIVTGLSDEADARRYLDKQFGAPRGFCRNCEVEYNVAGDLDGAPCPICFDLLVPPGLPPRRRKFNP